MRALLDRFEDFSSVTVMRVDWDTHRGGELVRTLRIPRRSTLVMFRGGVEVGRVVAQTAAREIEALLRAGL